MARKVIARIKSHKELNKGCFRMKIEAPLIARSALPGQFLHIRCAGSNDPLLRRPISIHRIGSDDIEILYSVVGRGTGILSRKVPGELLDVIGPLGNGFRVAEDSASLKLLVAGGMGVAPLLALAERLPRAAKGEKRFIAVLGARTRNHILCEDDFRKIGGEVHIATEDGSKGKRGLATELASEIVNSGQCRLKDLCIYCAGPVAMIKALCPLVKGCSLESQASLEERMACGVGACLGCAVETRSGFRRVCKDGPVFNICDILVDN